MWGYPHDQTNQQQYANYQQQQYQQGQTGWTEGLSSYDALGVPPLNYNQNLNSWEGQPMGYQAYSSSYSVPQPPSFYQQQNQNQNQNQYYQSGYESNTYQQSFPYSQQGYQSDQYSSVGFNTSYSNNSFSHYDTIDPISSTSPLAYATFPPPDSFHSSTSGPYNQQQPPPSSIFAQDSYNPQQQQQKQQKQQQQPSPFPQDPYGGGTFSSMSSSPYPTDPYGPSNVPWLSTQWDPFSNFLDSYGTGAGFGSAALWGTSTGDNNYNNYVNYDFSNNPSTAVLQEDYRKLMEPYSGDPSQSSFAGSTGTDTGEHFSHLHNNLQSLLLPYSMTQQPQPQPQYYQQQQHPTTFFPSSHQPVISANSTPTQTQGPVQVPLAEAQLPNHQKEPPFSNNQQNNLSTSTPTPILTQTPAPTVVGGGTVVKPTTISGSGTETATTTKVSSPSLAEISPEMMFRRLPFPNRVSVAERFEKTRSQQESNHLTVLTLAAVTERLVGLTQNLRKVAVLSTSLHDLIKSSYEQLTLPPAPKKTDLYSAESSLSSLLDLLPQQLHFAISCPDTIFASQFELLVEQVENLSNAVEALIRVGLVIGDPSLLPNDSTKQVLTQERLQRMAAQHHLAISLVLKKTLETVEDLRLSEKRLEEGEEDLTPPPPPPEDEQEEDDEIPPPPPPPDTRPVTRPRFDPNGKIYDVNSVLSLQRIFRRRKAYKLWSKKVDEYRTSKASLTERSRFRLLKEIKSTEETYVKSLGQVVNSYLKPLRIKKSISDGDLAAIFSSIEIIYTVNLQFLASIGQRLEEFPSNQYFGDIFLKMLPTMKMYTSYVTGFDNASQTLQRCQKENKEFNAFLEEVSQKHGILNLSSLLIQPVQRLPRYELLLKELLKLTAEEHIDIKNLQNALRQIKEVNMYVNKQKLDRENRDKIYSLEKQSKGLPATLLAPHRMLLREEDIEVVSGNRTKPGHIVLFNDMLVLFTIHFDSFIGGSLRMLSQHLTASPVQNAPPRGRNVFEDFLSLKHCSVSIEKECVLKIVNEGDSTKTILWLVRFPSKDKLNCWITNIKNTREIYLAKTYCSSIALSVLIDSGAGFVASA